MHYLSSVYFVNQPLHIPGVFIAHHQEVYCIYTTRCIYTVYHKSTAPTLGNQKPLRSLFGLTESITSAKPVLIHLEFFKQEFTKSGPQFHIT